IYLDDHFNIKSTECECPKGKFKCSHARLFFINGIHNLSRTDIECQWRKKTSNTSLSLQAVEELFPLPKNYVAITRSPNTEDRQALYGSLKAYGRFTGLCWLMCPEPAPQSQIASKLTEADILLVSQITVGQRDNPTWHLARRGRLTASNFGSVLHAKRVTPSLLKRLLGEYDISRVKAVQWGVNNEAEAIKAFTNLTAKTVQETGLWLDGSGILGASPDGIYALKEEHVYWHQVQGEIHFAQRKLCYFVVWTSKDVVVLKIAKDEGWSGNISKLTQFYFEHLFPKVVEGQL
ncbi:unnamed protein product, partial [Pocillopora meandrina]